MKCPKCNYIGFENADRCKNCGYEFSLATGRPQPAPELPMSPAGDDGGPLRDLALKPGADTARKSAPLDLDRVIGAPDPAADLPLFAADGTGEDLPPLVAPPVAPRRPLAVRRPTPDPARMRPRPRDDARERPSAPTLPLPAEPFAAPASQTDARRASPRTPVAALPGEEAPPLLRVAAALVDVIILGAINALTFYFTLRLCGLSAADWRVLPVLPLAAFFLLLDGGYLTLFTAAGGQTIGKMAFRLKVVGYEDAPVPVGLSLLRALGCVASTVCLGLGLLPAFFGGRLALHDRLADTRVVRASA
jgi:uncharacterized RDD family membrane protein YckC